MEFHRSGSVPDLVPTAPVIDALASPSVYSCGKIVAPSFSLYLKMEQDDQNGLQMV